MSKLIVALVLVPLAACASRDMKLVARATAYDTYYQDSYPRKCQSGNPPAACTPCMETLNLAGNKVVAGEVVLGLIATANKVQQIGPLPPAEVEELKDLIKRLETCP